MKTELWTLTNAEKSARLALPPPLKKRHNRRKTHIAWEQANLASGGLYDRSLDALAIKFPMLTTMELQVCVLVKERLPSWKIAEVLVIDARTVENHRTIARRIMKVPHGMRLITYL